MAFCIMALLIILRRPWLWAVVGGLWSSVLLSIWTVGGFMAYTSANTVLFPTLLMIQTVGALMALAVGLLHLRLRLLRNGYPSRWRQFS